MKRFKQLTALLLTLAMLWQITAYAVDGTTIFNLDRGTYDALLEKAEEGAVPVITTEGAEISSPAEIASYEPASQGAYESEETVNLGISGDDAAQTDIVLPQFGKIILSSDIADGKWQVKAGGSWVTVPSEGRSFEVTFAKIKNLLDSFGGAKIRRISADGTRKTVAANVSVLYGSQKEPQPVAVKKAPDKAPANNTNGDPGSLTKVRVRVEYYLKNVLTGQQEKITDAYTEAQLQAGANFRQEIVFPSIIGYKPWIIVNNNNQLISDPVLTNDTQLDSITLDYQQISEDKTVRVDYLPTWSPYTVVRREQNLLDDGYTVSETITYKHEDGMDTSSIEYRGALKTGDMACGDASYLNPDGTYATDVYTAVVADDRPGFFTISPTPVMVAADGTTVVEIYYDRDYFLLDLDLDGGHGVEPLYDRYGTDISQLGTPTKKGYNFHGWIETDVNSKIILYKQDGTEIRINAETGDANFGKYNIDGTWTDISEIINRISDNGVITLTDGSTAPYMVHVKTPWEIGSNGKLNGEYHYKANWEKDQTHYRIAYYLQNSDDVTIYDYVDTVEVAATTGDAITAIPNEYLQWQTKQFNWQDVPHDENLEDYQHNQYMDVHPGADGVPESEKIATGHLTKDDLHYSELNAAKTNNELAAANVVVSGDGTTVVRVYFDRQKFNLRFYYAQTYKSGTRREYYVVGGSTYHFGKHNDDAGDTVNSTDKVDRNNAVELLNYYYVKNDTSTPGKYANQVGQVTSLPQLNADGNTKGYVSGEENNGGVRLPSNFREKYGDGNTDFNYIELQNVSYGADIRTKWPIGVFNNVGISPEYHGISTASFSGWNGEYNVWYSQHQSNQTIKGRAAKLDYQLLWDWADGKGDNDTVSFLGFWDNGAQIGWSIPRLFRYNIMVPCIAGESYATAPVGYDGIVGDGTKYYHTGHDANGNPIYTQVPAGVPVTIERNGTEYYLLGQYDTYDDAVRNSAHPHPSVIGFAPIGDAVTVKNPQNQDETYYPAGEDKHDIVYYDANNVKQYLTGHETYFSGFDFNSVDTAHDMYYFYDRGRYTATFYDEGEIDNVMFNVPYNTVLAKIIDGTIPSVSADGQVTFATLDDARAYAQTHVNEIVLWKNRTAYFSAAHCQPGVNYAPPYPKDYEDAQDALLFNGWYTSANFNPATQIFFRSDASGVRMPARDGAVYGRWVPNIHIVRFFMNKSDLPTTDMPADQDQPNELTAKRYTIEHGNVTPSDNRPGMPETYPGDDYEFKGWFYHNEKSGHDEQFDFAAMPVIHDMNLYAKFTSNVMVNYTITYRLQDGDGNDLGEAAPPTTGAAPAGSSVTFQAKKNEDGIPDGWFPDKESTTLDLTPSADGQPDHNTAVFIYKEEDPKPYTVHYLKEDLTELLPPKVVNNNHRIAVTEEFVPVDGYLPDKPLQTLFLKAGDVDENVITFIYRQNTEDAYYFVEYWQEEPDGSYSMYRKVDCLGKVGNEYTADPDALTVPYRTYAPDTDKTVNGVHYKEVKEGVLTAGEKMELKLYYDLNHYPYTVEYIKWGTTDAIHTVLSGEENYGSLVTVSAPDIDGYEYYRTSEPRKTAYTDNRNVSFVMSDSPNLNRVIFYYREKTAIINYQTVPKDVGEVIVANAFGANSERVNMIDGISQGATAAGVNSNERFEGWYSDEQCTHLVSSNAAFVPVPENVEGNTTAHWLDEQTFYAKFNTYTPTLTISKTGVDAEDSDMVFLFTITGDENPGGVTVAVKGNGSATLTGVELGKSYTVTEKDDWTWRYTPDTASQTVTITNENDNKVTFNNKKTSEKWLDGNSSAVNYFGRKN